MKNQAILVISGHNIRAVIAFCRWATAHNINYHVVAKSKEDPIFLTDYKNRVEFTRDSPSLCSEHFHTWVGTLCRQFGYQRITILPSTEYLNRFLLEYRNSIEAEDCVIPLVDDRLYRTISDKQSFAKLCQSYGLDIPVEFNGIPDRLPFVAKPRAYFSAQGKQLVPHIVDNQHTLEIFCDKEQEKDYFFQQFVYGRSLYLLAYISRRAIHHDVLFSQENLMQETRGGSIILAKQSDFHHHDIAKRYVNMLHDQKFFGLIMVEVRLDESNGRYYMIEANPRLWGPLQFSVDNNVDLFGAMLRDYGYEISPRATHPTTHYFWSGGLSQHSQPIAYHSYTSDEFVREFPNLRPQDIFFRKDTLNLFLKESEMMDCHEFLKVD